MSKFKSFFKKAAKPIETVKVTLDRFPEPFEMRPLTPQEQEDLMDMSKKKRVGKRGKIEEVLSEGKYMRLRVSTSMSYPDLSDSELQASYGVVGEQELLNAMLTADEVSELVLAVESEIKETTTTDLVDEAKN